MSPTPAARERRTVISQLPLFVWLVVLWMLLWGSVSWLNLVTGVAVGLIVMRVFYLPPILLSGRFNIWWALVFIVQFVWDVVRGSIQVAYLALVPNRKPMSSVIAVQLQSRSDLIMLLVTFNVSLVPGSLIVEADRYRSILYIHAIDTVDERGVEHARFVARRSERRIVRVIGSKEDLRRTEAAWKELA